MISMPITIDKKIWDDLDKFFASKTIQDIDRNTFLHCGLRDNINKISISLVFTKHYDISESDNYNYVAIANEGAVFTFPCHWVSIPKELAMPYFKTIITEFYNNEVSNWKNSNANIGNSTGGNNSDNGCGCRPQCGIV